MKWIIYILIVGLIVVASQTIFNLYDFGGFVPNILLLVVLAMVVAFENWDYIFLAAAGGFWLDIVYGLPVGTQPLGLIGLGLLFMWAIEKWLYANKDWRHFLGAIIIGSALMYLWIWFYSSVIFSLGWNWVRIDTVTMMKNLIPNLIANLILAYPVFILVDFVAGYLERKSKNKLLI